MTPALRPPGLSRLTVRGWQGLLLSTMGVMVLAGAVVGAVLLQRTDEVSREVSDRIQPARVAATELQSALRDQETGLRGYVIAADRQFLTPCYDGQHAEQAAAEDIRRRLGQRTDLIADLDAIEKAAANWRTNYAEPLIATVTPNAPNVVNRRASERGKVEFDHLRALFDNGKPAAHPAHRASPRRRRHHPQPYPTQRVRRHRRPGNRTGTRSCSAVQTDVHAGVPVPSGRVPYC